MRRERRWSPENLLKQIGVVPTRFVLTVSVARQTVCLYENSVAAVCGNNWRVNGWGAQPSRLLPGASSVATDALRTATATFAAPEAGALPIRGKPVWRRRYTFRKKFRCSTSRFGMGQEVNSNCTPLGWHRITQKIGGGWPAGTVFKGRQPIGFTWKGMPEARITSRVFWLEGLEAGFNRGGNVDSRARYIYIHGTGDEATIGRPDSCGCIHLAAPDLIPLYDKLPRGTLVWIGER